MRILLGPKKKHLEWHKWFAWTPLFNDDDMLIFEWVWRRKVGKEVYDVYEHGPRKTYEWEYSTKKEKPKE